MRGHRHDVPMTGSLLPIPTTGSKAVGSGGNRTRNHHSQRSGGRLLFLQGRMHTRAPKSARLNVLHASRRSQHVALSSLQPVGVAIQCFQKVVLNRMPQEYADVWLENAFCAGEL